jgi:hypothetical protein
MDERHAVASSSQDLLYTGTSKGTPAQSQGHERQLFDFLIHVAARLELRARGKQNLLGHFHFLRELVLGRLHQLARKLRNHTQIRVNHLGLRSALQNAPAVRIEHCSILSALHPSKS